jgi:hypothetical protein
MCDRLIESDVVMLVLWLYIYIYIYIYELCMAASMLLTRDYILRYPDFFFVILFEEF